jgi:hypothetical protein
MWLIDFQCPYVRTDVKEVNGTANAHLDVDDLFRLQKMTFIDEIALAKARKDNSESSDKR